MESKRPDINELSETVLAGIRVALKKLAETSALNKESLVVADENGNPKTVPAKELLSLLK